MSDLQLIQKSAEQVAPYVREAREHLHANPELAFNEKETSAFIAAKLKESGLVVKTGVGGFGVVGILDSGKPGKTVALRADMDALPLDEKNDVPYKSVHKGVMHACGHDLHVASLLGTAKILASMKEKLTGKVIFVFQPAEEKLPGGAIAMIREELFGSDKPDVMIAQHVNPSMKAGTAGFRKGMYMASTDEIYITVRGKGGHAAMPHQLTDSVLVASHIVVSLQQIVSRQSFAAIPSVLSFGKFIANGATNIIPDEVVLEGTFRTMDETWRAKALQSISKMAMDVASAMGASAEVKIVNGYPSLYNNPEVTASAKAFASEYLGEDNTEDMDLRMTAEDFSYFALEYPSTFYRIGTFGGTSSQFPLHSSSFDIDNEVYKSVHGLMAWIAYRFLTS